MLVEVLPADHSGSLTIPAVNVVIRNEVGTPICVAISYGNQGACRVAHANDAEFPRLLQVLGLPPIEVNEVRLSPPPPGGRLVSPH